MFLSTVFASLVLISGKAQPTTNVGVYFPFLGNTYDYAGKVGSCQNVGATLAADRLGKANAAYLFNGSSNYLLLSNSALSSSNAFAISCWIKPLGNHASSDIYSQTIVDLRGEYQIALSYNQPGNPTNPNSMQFYIYSNPTATVINSANNSIPLNTWTHVAACYGSNTMSLYINGILVASQTSNAPSAVSGYINTIGKDYATWNNRGWVYGYIDEVIIYNQNLTQTDVQAIYNRGLATSEIPEICAPIKYTYDLSGNRTDRNIVTLKSVPANLRDSVERQSSLPKEQFEDNLGDQKILIYPNPTQGQLLIEIQGYKQETASALYLYDLTGKLLIARKPVNSNMPLDLSHYAVGTYILKIVLGDKTSEWKIVKE
jgi:hypothetical protein